jgi:hypothetical protein
MRPRTLALAASALGLATLAGPTFLPASAQRTETAPMPSRQQNATAHPYLGMWVTRDGQIRQELLPNGRYDEARGTRRSAYQGRYEVRGNEILYWDDTGFTADGRFVSEDELHHGGMTFLRER